MSLCYGYQTFYSPVPLQTFNLQLHTPSRTRVSILSNVVFCHHCKLEAVQQSDGLVLEAVQQSDGLVIEAFQQSQSLWRGL